MKTKINTMLSAHAEITKRELSLKNKIFRLAEDVLNKMPDGKECVPIRIDSVFANQNDLSEAEKYRQSVSMDGVSCAYKSEEDCEIHYARIGKLYRDEESGRVMVSGFEYDKTNGEAPFATSIDTLLDTTAVLLFLKEFYEDPDEPELNSSMRSFKKKSESDDVDLF